MKNSPGKNWPVPSLLNSSLFAREIAATTTAHICPEESGVFHEHVDRPAYPARTCEERQGRSFKMLSAMELMILSRWVDTNYNSTAAISAASIRNGQPRSGKPGLSSGRFPPKSNLRGSNRFPGPAVATIAPAKRE